MPEFHSAPKKLLSTFFRRRSGSNVPVTVFPKNEGLRFSFGEREFGGYPTVPVIAERHVS